MLRRRLHLNLPPRKGLLSGTAPNLSTVKT
jgi:hypothetical protein